ncbi:hypothetical protein CMI37_11870 [Candidatus Pacearchaeota archaeon]|nr:hypothetical protein [Candidatus Pacearchaeota archaeon]|tara:strand:+ start:274 stop:528 length:255 start_codon:yes stop_codon:yes gene_type:complete
MAKRVGSGRTKGAVSFVSVKLGELNRILKEDAPVLVNRRYAELLKLSGNPIGISAAVIKEHVGHKVEEEIEVNVEEPKPIKEYV